MKIEGSADVGDKSTPKDAQVMAAILRDMGITDYEPRVINQVIFLTSNIFCHLGIHQLFQSGKKAPSSGLGH